MATGAGAVNIRLGLIVSDVIAGANAGRAAINRLTSDVGGKLAGSFAQADRQQRIYDKGLGRAGQTMQDYGKKAAVVSGIILGIGAAAFSSYANIDGMQRGLKAVVGDATEANIQFKEFRQLARLPGLGLGEVTKSGLSLETLGFKAREAQKDIYEVGNAIALAGDGKEAFAAVITQFTQMAGKSKVLGDDLKPILNASPVIAKAISSIFGTVDSEAISEKLQAAGKGPRDFINLLVAELAKLERVQGGPKNAVENFTDSLTIAGYEAAKAADEVLDLTGKIDAAGSFVSNTATAFGQLPAPAKAATIGIVGLTVAAGPLVLGLGTIIRLLPTASAGLGALRVAAVAATGPIGLTVTAVAGLGLAAYSVYQFNTALKSTVDTEQLLAGVSRDMAAAMSTERARLESLVKIARDETESKQARANAIKQINALSPKYLGDITTETINTAKASTAIREYLGLISLKAKARVAEQKLGEAEVKLEEAQARRRAKPQVSTADALAATLENPLEIFFGQGKDGKGRQAALDRTKARNILAEQDAQKEVDFYKGLFEKTNTELTRLGENTKIDVPTIDFSGSGKSRIQEDKARLKKLASEIASDKLNGLDTSAKQIQYDQLKAQIDDATSSLKNQRAASDSVGGSLSVNERILKRLTKELKDQGATASPGLARQVSLFQDLVKAEKELVDNKPVDLGEKVKNIETVGRARQALMDFIDPLNQLDGLSTRRNDLLNFGSLGYFRQELEKIRFQASRLSLQGLLLSDDDIKRQVSSIKQLKDEQDALTLNDIRVDNAFGGDLPKFSTVERIIGQIRSSKTALDISVQELVGSMQAGRVDMINATVGFLSGVGEAAAKGESPLKAGLKFILGYLGDYAIKIGTAALISSKALLLAAPFLAGLTLPQGIGLQVAGAGLVVAGGLVKGIAARPFANGGIAYGPTYGLVGEYSGARNNPEVIAPLNKLKSIIGDRGTQVFIPDIVIDGQQLRIVLQRANDSYSQFS